jgi:hypothetical protein
VHRLNREKYAAKSATLSAGAASAIENKKHIPRASDGSEPFEARLQQKGARENGSWMGVR